MGNLGVRLMPKILVIGDSHVEPEQDLERFTNLGKLIVVERPTHIVQLGDFLSLGSVSHWDRNKRLLVEGRRYSRDIGAGKEALRLLSEPVREHNRQCRAAKRKLYSPSVIWLLGNHEEWVERYVEQHPEMQGQMDVVNDLDVSGSLDWANGVAVVPYRMYAEIASICFTHTPIAANGQSLSGMYAVHRASELYTKSLVFGHTHRLEMFNNYRFGDDELQQVVTAGSFFEHDFDYAEGAASRYWRGVLMLHVYSPGRFDVETISLNRLAAKYGNVS